RPRERPSAARLAPALTAAAILLACAPGASHAQPPSCAWGGGVSLPGGDDRTVILAADGAAGVFAISTPVYEGFGNLVSWLRIQHVLEQGRLDPSLPANGVTILTNADVPEHPVLDVLRAVPDAAGGVYVLISCCNPFLPHTRCYEAAEFRLLHSTASGTTA